MLSVEVQAEQLKQKGNEYFKKEKISAAIDAYTEAIALCPSVVAYWTNRALCFKKREDWERVRDDCKKALEMDKSNFKAHRLLGQANLQLKHFPEAIRSLNKAMELGMRQSWGLDNPNIMELEKDLLRAKYEQWQIVASERRQKQSRLKERLMLLLKEDHEQRMQGSNAEQDTLSKVPKHDGWWASRHTEKERAGAEACSQCRHCISESCNGECAAEGEHLEMLNTLENIFHSAESADIPGEVPEFFCCQITMELFRDPVVAPSGVTYEKSVILAHLARGNKFDPLTRGPLEEHNLVPNIAMKEAVEDFLGKHGWAHQAVFHPSSMSPTG